MTARRRNAPRRNSPLAQDILIRSAESLRAAARMYEPPYDPWKVASHMNVQVRDTFLNGIEGYVEFFRDLPSVVLDSKACPSRRRFTLAHELGHIILIQRTQASYQVGLTRYRSGVPEVGAHSDPEEERLCDAFAAALLMPWSDVREFWRLRPVSAEGLSEFSNTFAVSLTAASVRTAGLRRSLHISFWDTAPWPIRRWQTGRALPRNLIRAIEQSVQHRTQNNAHVRSPDFKQIRDAGWSADARICGRHSLLLVLSSSEQWAEDPRQQTIAGQLRFWDTNDDSKR